MGLFVQHYSKGGTYLRTPGFISRLIRPGSISRRTGTVLAGSVISKALSFATMWLMVQYFAPEEFGCFSVIDTVNGFCSGAVANGLNWWLVRSVARGSGSSAAKKAARTIFVIEMIYGLAVGAALLIGAPFVAGWFFSKPELVPFVRLSAVGVISYILVAYRSSLYHAFKLFFKDAVFNVVNSGLFFIAALVVIRVLRRGVLLLGTLYVVIPVVVSGIALLMPAFASRLKTHEEDDIHAETLPDRGYSWLLLYSISLWLASQVHLLVMTRTRSLEELGAYALAMKIYLVSLMLTNAINVVLLPEFSACRSRAEMRSRYGRIFKFTALGAAVIAAFIPLAGIILGVIAGNRYIEATPILRILLVGTAISTLLSPPVNVLFAEGRYRTIAIAGASMALVNTAGQILLTPRYGATVAAWVLVGSFLLMNGTFSILASKLLSQPD